MRSNDSRIGRIRSRMNRRNRNNATRSPRRNWSPWNANLEGRQNLGTQTTRKTEASHWRRIPPPSNENNNLKRRGMAGRLQLRIDPDPSRSNRRSLNTRSIPALRARHRCNPAGKPSSRRAARSTQGRRCFSKNKSNKLSSSSNGNDSIRRSARRISRIERRPRN
jgi:hypothetical protein